MTERWTRIRTWRLFLLTCFVASGVHSLAPVRAENGTHLPASESERKQRTLRDQADQLVAAQRWEDALSLYLQLAANERFPELRERIQLCLRHVLQLRRLHDPAIHAQFVNLPLARALDVYAEAITRLQQNYLDRERSLPGRLVRLGLESISAALEDAQFRQRYCPIASESELRIFQAKLRDGWQNRAVQSGRDARSLLSEIVFQAKRDLHFAPPGALILEALSGACEGLDEYTSFQSPETLVAEAARPLSEFASYGITLQIDGDQLRVADIRSGSMAATQGLLHKGDRILRINRNRIERPSAMRIAEWVRATFTSTVELEVQPVEAEDRMVVRVPNDLPTVVGARIIRDAVGYLHLNGFRESSISEVDAALNQLRAAGMKSLILDLRGNPGGQFLIAVQVAERFLPDGIIVSTQGQLEELNRTYTAQSGPNAWIHPMIVLIDSETASSAEVLAAALKENQRATLIGTVTYGKGLLQAMIPLMTGAKRDDMGQPTPQNGALRVSIGRLLTPMGTPIQSQGVSPNVVEPHRDRQLELAIEQASRLASMR
ncbi:S41 family peptidase [Tuwongella immobilis]|uniref:PDZ domain-containing protein n=1 Tax=Tuwongella immobilis TaxID=692036 RepID=A0A6C2YTQ3_9BACT|nr:S41 family peptidase [Tuwongella immobilis]VIP04503.1 carboxyl-terminal protease : Carboxyl-terminal protease OS=Planctomyces limnophilus (strain ATCC 43296 / DSM 3776 / IFAM 1008 / 290) GN=Plim_0662 PE=3 SV=1: PDZ: Peptidase_S41 [Tuwongella immobilis]VTS06368.1 carboxyl-terminal protease : Carboxyl-terminal protease OS=Planctomyces limnophilus (strain ATCC 43296 / DSM 3776 / IFAM 1008 / 290) GN=Plim_0662 PE=3 SV=1: PDZ: Peptidase_S41 [Tuwongella immobilis]